MEPKTCCFTGHRPQGLPWGTVETDPRCMGFQAVLAYELEQAWREGYRVFWCGMARGGDLLFAEAVLACQQVHPDVKLFAAIPCPNQIQGWPHSDVERYWHILRFIGAERCTMISSHYTPGCMHQRNRYMVDRSSRLIALYDGHSRGGTGYTVNYARQHGLESVIIDPLTLQTRREPSKN